MTSRRLLSLQGSTAATAYRGGHLCPDDAALVDEIGSIVPSLLERSVWDAVDPDSIARRKRMHEPQLIGVTAWADVARTWRRCRCAWLM
ncbi:hypothetical protein [Microbacterium xylanilyticum]